MASLVERLTKAGKISPPSFVKGATVYETIMGSQAYGVTSNDSDWDVYGFCMPDLGTLFPHTRGEILGFGEQKQRFEQWQQHHINETHGSGNERSYDIQIFSIVKYFHLCMKNNPNMVDSLFTPNRCVVHSSNVAEMVRGRRRDFLHKGAWHTFKGYAYAQMHKIDLKTNSTNPARAELIAKHGYDLKFAYHVVRLMDEAEQILVEGDIDLERNREQLKSIRRGEWTLQQIKDYIALKERTLAEVYTTCKLPHKPDEPKIKALLIDCLEQHYGSLSRVTSGQIGSENTLLGDLRELVERHSR